MSKLPKFIKTKLASNPKIVEHNRQKLKKLGLATVCQEAKCPNLGECWSQNTATFMIMGDTCTRGCKFCNVKTGMPEQLDKLEPHKIGIAVKKMQLDYVVITSVDRDDLDDQGANHFAEVIKQVKKYNPGIKVEVLIPDFRGNTDLLDIVIQASPEVIAHNVETTQALTSQVRDFRANYKQSLKVLDYIKTKSKNILTKTSIMLGLGESENDLKESFKDLSSIKLDILTLGQYLQPSPKHLEVKEFIKPGKYSKLSANAESIGIKLAVGSPMMRSSYKAHEFYNQLTSKVCS
jgi:lipoyl synthase